LAEADAHRQQLRFQVAGADERPEMQDFSTENTDMSQLTGDKAGRLDCGSNASSSRFGRPQQSNGHHRGRLSPDILNISPSRRPKPPA
jgi:hypothetical protein